MTTFTKVFQHPLGFRDLLQILVPESRDLNPVLPHMPHTAYRLPPFFSTTFPFLTANYLPFHRHSRFASEFSTAVLCFQ